MVVVESLTSRYYRWKRKNFTYTIVKKLKYFLKRQIIVPKYTFKNEINYKTKNFSHWSENSNSKNSTDQKLM